MRDTLPLPLMAAIAALPPLAVDMYLPAIPQIATNLNTQISSIQNSLSIFLLGFGLGMLVFGPFSDRYGRRPLVLLGLTGFALTSLCLTLSTSSQWFLLFRLLQGFLGSAATVVIPAMIRDCYGRDTARGMSAVSMIMLVAPLLAPLMGSAVLAIMPWQGIFGFLTLYPVVLFALTWWRLPETRPASDGSAPRSLLANYGVILGKREIYLDLLCYMLSSMAFFTYLTSVSFVYITWFGVSETVFGILFAGSACALILANFINVRVVSSIGPRRMLDIGLGLGCLCGAALVGITWLELGLYWTVACFICIVGSLGICAVNADALVLIQFPQQASSASAVTGTLRFGFGALSGPILAYTYNGTPLPVALVLLAMLVGAALMQGLRQLQSR